MLNLPPLLRSDLWQRTDWSQRIVELADSVEARESSFESPEQVAQWAHAAECVVPDRRIAIRLYEHAWVGKNNLEWLHRARSMALEIGDFEWVAKLAGLEYDHRPSPHLLTIQALAFLDAGRIELAMEPLRAAIIHNGDESGLRALQAACEERFEELPQTLQQLDDQAIAETRPIVCSGLMLTCARLARIYSGSVDAESYLVRAFNFNPANEIAFSLLESRLIDCHDWARLANTYRVRTEHLASQGRDIDAYRRAGTRLSMSGSLPGLGVRLLQEGIQLTYRRDTEEVDDLLAMLRLLIEQLVEGGGVPAAVRLLAQALAHPRSDDEVMWIVNVGIKLAADDQAMQRTKMTFETLRNRLVVEASDETSKKLAFDEIDGEVDDWIEDDDLTAIGDEMSELTRPSGVGAEVAFRVQLVADVNVTIRAKSDGSVRVAEAVTRDVSMSGLFLNCAEVLQVGDELELTMLLPGEDDWSLEEHEIKGIIARVVGDKGYGVHYSEVSEAYLDGVRSLGESQLPLVP